MPDAESKFDPHFMQLVMSLQQGAMQQMGKVANPMTGKVERDLSMAKFSIDMLGMIQAKTKGNLSEDEQKMLDHVLYELRLNFVDESKKSPESESDGGEGQTKPEEAPSEGADDSQSDVSKDSGDDG